MIIVLDHERIKADKRSCEYIKAFIKRLNWVTNEKLNIIYNMFEARVSSKNKWKNSKNYIIVAFIIYAISFKMYISYQRINLARDFLLTISLTEINITRSLILNLFELEFAISMNDQNVHD